MLKLLILAALFGLLGNMLRDLWRQWLAARLGTAGARSPADSVSGAGTGRQPAAKELLQCHRCGVYAPAPVISLPGASFLCRRCRASTA